MSSFVDFGLAQFRFRRHRALQRLALTDKTLCVCRRTEAVDKLGRTYRRMLSTALTAPSTCDIFNAFPDDVLSAIFTFLRTQAVCSLSRVTWLMHAMLHKDRHVLRASQITKLIDKVYIDQNHRTPFRV